MSFTVDVIKDTVRLAEDRYADARQASASLDDKAQKTVTLAGLFLAAAFGFVKPDAAGSFLNILGIYSGIMTVITIVVFLASLAVCLSVMWVRSVPQALAIPILDELNGDLTCLPPNELTEQVQENYYKDLLALWGPIIERQIAVNAVKARRLRIAQALLGCGMLSVAALLFSLIVDAMAAVPKL
jgi:hypothetical protein